MDLSLDVQWVLTGISFLVCICGVIGCAISLQQAQKREIAHEPYFGFIVGAVSCGLIGVIFLVLMVIALCHIVPRYF